MVTHSQARQRENEARKGLKNYTNWEMTSTAWRVAAIVFCFVIGPCIGLLGYVSYGSRQTFDLYWLEASPVMIVINVAAGGYALVKFLEYPFAGRYKGRVTHRELP